MEEKSYIKPTTSAEDRLPEGQKVIETVGVRRVRRFMKFVMTSREDTGYPTMGVFTGRAGIGKTIAMQAFIDQFPPRSHTGLPPIIKVKVKPESSPKALVEDILTSLEEGPEGSNRFKLTDQVVDAIARNDVDLLAVDEGDWLNTASFDLLRSIHDKSGCPVVIAGLPRLLTIIKRKLKFASRVGIGMRFPVCTKREVLTIVLPQLAIPYWKYDPQSDKDKEMGERIYELVGSSLRDLRSLVCKASQIIAVDGGTHITRADIEEAFRTNPFEDSSAGKDEVENDKAGDLERMSELRQAAKHKHKGE
jgi:hypothetical protein